MSLFGSSGIRGVVGADFTVDLAAKIGNAVGSLHGEIIHGRDPRLSGLMVLQALVAGETAAGAQVYDAGMVPTPTLAMAAEDFDCGIMITASHNPPEYNGIKLWNADGSAFNSEQMAEIEKRIAADWQTVGWKSTGSYQSWEGAIEKHTAVICDALTDSSAKTVIDCGCGATSVISPLVLRTLGCKVTSLNAQPDGYFPGRTSEPTEEQLQDLKTLVIKKEADVGIAHDGDGDRMVAVDETGKYLSGDRLLLLFASWLGVNSIAVPVDASMAVDDLVKEVHRCRVGDVFISELLKERDIDFGGEPSGTYVFPEEYYCPDGIFAGALLSKIAAERKLSESIAELPTYPAFRGSSSFNSAQREVVTSRLAEEMAAVDCDHLTVLDGYRAESADGWFLIRLSGTEPKLRFVAEARAETEAREFKEQAEKIIQRCIA